MKFGGRSVATKQSKKSRNVLSNMFELIEATSGYRFDLNAAMEGNLDLASSGTKPNTNFYRELESSKTQKLRYICEAVSVGAEFV